MVYYYDEVYAEGEEVVCELTFYYVRSRLWYRILYVYCSKPRL